MNLYFKMLLACELEVVYFGASRKRFQIFSRRFSIWFWSSLSLAKSLLFSFYLFSLACEEFFRCLLVFYLRRCVRACASDV